MTNPWEPHNRRTLRVERLTRGLILLGDLLGLLAILAVFVFALVVTP